MTKSFFGALLTVVALAGTASAGEPVYLKAGQCILVGGQQICAMQGDAAAADAKVQTLYVCRYGMHEGQEIPDLKTYALVQVRLQPSGSKTETLVKNYGPADKEVCEKEAEKREAAAK